MIRKRKNISNNSGIYQIESKITKRIYIGSAVNLKKRIREHKYHLKLGNHGNQFIQKHFNKYGLDDLQFFIIEFCKKDKLIEREQFYIDLLKPKFNFCKIAGSTLGTIRSEETKNKMIGENNPMYGISRKGKLAPMYGKKHSEDTKLKMSESHKKTKYTYWKDKKFSEETRIKMSISHFGENNHFYGKHHSDETKEKLSLKKLGTTLSIKTKNKMRQSRLAFYSSEKGILMKEHLREIRKKQCYGS